MRVYVISRAMGVGFGYGGSVWSLETDSVFLKTKDRGM